VWKLAQKFLGSRTGRAYWGTPGRKKKGTNEARVGDSDFMKKKKRKKGDAGKCGPTSETFGGSKSKKDGNSFRRGKGVSKEKIGKRVHC